MTFFLMFAKNIDCGYSLEQLWTHRPEQALCTQDLEEQSNLGLHCLQLHLHIFLVSLICETSLFK